MGALRQPRLAETPKKAPAAETRKLDKYGRDPDSPVERLRAGTDYDKQTGYAPFFRASLADLHRLASGATFYAFVLTVNELSYGRPRAEKARFHEWTLPISALDLAELCRANVRDIQRQLSELAERGLIAVKLVKNGTVKYCVSLLYSKWREIEDYAVWKRRQVVEIDSAGDDEPEDEAPQAISKDAVSLFKKPPTVRPGRASRPAKVNVGITEVVCENRSTLIDVTFDPVVQSGRLVFAVSPRVGESQAKGEEKGNAERHPCRALPPNEGRVNTQRKTAVHARAAELCKIFDPVLSRWAAPLLAMDSAALQKACEQLGDMPQDFLLHWLMRPNGRASRRISGALAVASIVEEARRNWEAQSGRHAEIESQVPHCACGAEISVDGECWDCHNRRHDAKS